MSFLTKQQLAQLTNLINSTQPQATTLLHVVQQFVAFCLASGRPVHTLFIATQALIALLLPAQSLSNTTTSTTPQSSPSSQVSPTSSQQLKTIPSRVVSWLLVLNYLRFFRYILQQQIAINSNTTTSSTTQQEQIQNASKVSAIQQLLSTTHNVSDTDYHYHPFLHYALRQLEQLQSDASSSHNAEIEAISCGLLQIPPTGGWNISLQQLKASNTRPSKRSDADVKSIAALKRIVQQRMEQIQQYQTAINQQHSSTSQHQQAISSKVSPAGDSTVQSNGLRPPTAAATAGKDTQDDWHNRNGQRTHSTNTAVESWEDIAKHDTDSKSNAASDEQSQAISNTQLRDGTSKALKQAIAPNEKQQLLEQIRSLPAASSPSKLAAVLSSCGLDLTTLPQLIDRNPSIASDVMLMLLDPNRASNSSMSFGSDSAAGTVFDDWLSVLLNIDVSLHTMEVVNRLVAGTTLTPEFLRQYIIASLRTCQQTTDKYLQQRLVRLVCVFISSLLRNSVVNAEMLGDALLIELQSFALDFSKVKEATQLYGNVQRLV